MGIGKSADTMLPCSPGAMGAATPRGTPKTLVYAACSLSSLSARQINISLSAQRSGPRALTHTEWSNRRTNRRTRSPLTPLQVRARAVAQLPAVAAAAMVSSAASASRMTVPIMRTVASGKAPDAASPLSMVASAPSHTCKCRAVQRAPPLSDGDNNKSEQGGEGSCARESVRASALGATTRQLRGGELSVSVARGKEKEDRCQAPYRVRNVAALGTRGDRVLDHGLHHLRGHDHRVELALLGGGDQQLLSKGYPGVAQFDAQVPAGHLPG